MKSILAALLSRLYRPFLHKFSLLFVAIYVVLYECDISVKMVLPFLFLALCTATGMAATGYLINDFTDRRSDALAGKKNIFLLVGNIKGYLLFIVAIALAALPWLLLPASSLTLMAIALEILLFLVYAFRPFRLKERGWAGVGCDSLYAHVIPFLLAGYTFSLFKPAAINPLLIAAAGAWLFLLGCRNILIHQIDDFNNDVQAQQQTIATALGVSKVRALLRQLFLPIEVVAFVVLLFTVGAPIWWLPLLLWIVYVFLYWSKRTFVDKIKWSYTAFEPPHSVFQFVTAQLLNEFYEKYLAPVFLCSVAIQHPAYLAILVFHLIIFWPMYKSDLFR